MENPIDILGVHPTGALPRRPDPRDYPFDPKEIAQATTPFDWTKGYDVEAEVSKVLGTTFVLPTKNQGTSGSCGGQSFAYYNQVLAAYYSKAPQERSAKYPYSQVYVGNVNTGGGSYDRDLANIGIHQGFGTEAATPSYPSWGGSPTEAFMERPQDITVQARVTAAGEKIISAYSFPKVDIDSIAQSLAGAQGCVIGVHGSNNGTWLSSDPKPPVAGEVQWAHYLYVGKAGMRNGKKAIAVKQSWGTQAAPDTNSWQWLNEDYFKFPGAVWSAINMVYNPVVTMPPQHVFNTNLSLGQSGPNVLALQQMLAYDGEFTLTPTGYYGQVTAAAVLKFQIKYQLASLPALAALAGGSVGPATRAKLNSMTTQ